MVLTSRLRSVYGKEEAQDMGKLSEPRPARP